MATPSLAAFVNDLIDQRLRQMQTSYPAEVVSYDSATSTATVKPLFIETWRGRDGSRTSETIENEEDSYVENVLVAFPRAGDFRVSLPIAAGDTGLVVATKYSLDRFRSGAGQSDPGDLRLFGMSGSVFFPVNLTTTARALDASDDDSVVTISEGGTAQFVALANLVARELSNIETTINSIVFTVDTSDGSGAVGSVGIPYTPGSVAASKLKAE